MNRQPAVAGYFYPAARKELLEQLGSFLVESEKTPALAVVVPHAGYMYSGHVAGAVYASVELPDTFVILCPNHTGMGSDFDLFPAGEWTTPLGEARVDPELSEALLQRFPRAQLDGTAHLREHSLEVQIPFLQYIRGRIRIVPLCVRQHRYEYLEELGHALADVIRGARRPVMIIASSDMNHYEDQQTTHRKDAMAIEQIQNLDPRGLYDTVNRYNITMCGYLPATATLIACRDLGATSADLIKHATSGDISGDYGGVVGYAGIRIR